MQKINKSMIFRPNLHKSLKNVVNIQNQKKSQKAKDR